MSDKLKNKIDWAIKIVLASTVVVLLIHNCEFKKNNGNGSATGNVDIIEIICNNNVCNKKIESLNFAQKLFSVKTGDTLNLVVNVKPTELSSSKFTWKSSDTSVATVDENGVVKGIKSGKVTITVTSENGKTATCTIEVVDNDVNVKKINLVPEKKEFAAGTVIQIKATVEPENATNRNLIWSSSDTSIATVNSKGVVKGIKPGTVTITAKTKNGKVVASTTITIKETDKEIESVSFSQKEFSVKKGNTLNLVAIVKPTELSSSKFTWKSSDTSIATVDKNGVVKGIKTGKVTITVTSENGKTATCTIDVVVDDVNVEKINLVPEKKEFAAGTVMQINATIEPENATNRDLVWSSSDTSIATVDSKGIVKGIKPGTVTITAKTKDGNVVASTSITIEETSSDGNVEVFDDDHNSVTWNGANDLKIFTNSMYEFENKIAPECYNTYQFVVKNSTNYQIKYNIEFIETNPYHINMKYKLKKNDTYLIDHYVSASELNTSDALLNVSDNDTFYLEWKWVSSDNDTQIGNNPNAYYGLKIEVKAESTNG